MPTLLQIDSCLNMLSTGRITESIGKLAIERGWDVYIVHGARAVSKPSCMKSIQSDKVWQEYLHYAESFLFDRHGLASRFTTKRVIEQIKQIQPDIIQLHCIHGYYMNYKLLFEYLNTTQIPIVWTFHDCWAFTGHCAYFDRVHCEKWKFGCRDCPLSKAYPKSLIDRSRYNYNIKKVLFTSNRYLHLVTVSHWLEVLTRKSFFADNDIRTIYNGVDIEVFHPLKNDILKLNFGNNKKVLLAVASSWNQRKGFDDYIRLARLLPNDIVIVLVGLPDYLISRLPNNVIGKKKTNSVDELVGYYSMADIVLNLSYEETFGLTTVEGFACGTPGVVYNATASPELITKETGIVVEPGNIEGVAEAIQEILRNGKNYYSNACRKRAEEYYDKDNKFAEYVDLYESLTKK